MKLVKIWVLVAILFVAGFLIFQAFTSAANPYLSVSEVKQHREKYIAREVQMIGNVTKYFGSGHQGLNFNLTDGSSSIQVSYEGPIPQNFMEGIRVVVIGRLSSDGHFVAKQILTKCPSKYVS